MSNNLLLLEPNQPLLIVIIRKEKYENISTY